METERPTDETTGTATAGPGRRMTRVWRSVRPRTRRGAALGAGLILVAAAALSVAFVVVAAQARSPYLQTVLHPDTNARAWAALAPAYAGAASCSSCHQTQAARASSAGHAGIDCESCHGPLLAHVLASPRPDALPTAAAAPTNAVCVRCHTSVVGRPIAFAQVVPSQHYVDACLDCHDPHSGISRRPPVVLHPLANLPPCLTCHGPEGFKARNQRHPDEPGDDATCLACHANDRGRIGPVGR